LCVLVGVMVVRLRSEGQVYQGKTIAAWSMQISSMSPQERQEAEAFFKAMGARAVPELIRLVNSREPVWRKMLWANTLKLGFQLRLKLLRHSKVPAEELVHSAAARALAIIGPEAKPAVPALGHVLCGKERAARWDAAMALGRIGKDSVAVLTRVLPDKDPEIRCAALSGLSGVGAGAEPAIPAVMEMLKDEKDDVRAGAVYCLAAIGPRAVPALVQAIERERGLVRRGAARVFLRLSVPRRLTEPALLGMAQDEDPASRAQAIASLAAIHVTDEAGITAMKTALRDPSLEVRVAAAKGLGDNYWKAQPAVPALIEALKDESAEVRQSAAMALGRMGPAAKAAAAALARLEADPVEAVRVAGKEALVRVEAGEGKSGR
jgi:HEAT repeat protein